jgi:phosphatidylglycerol:prolipoprotein diacylglycerol transferase
MFVHNINPVLFTLGPFEIRFYGLVYGFGFLLFYLLLHRLAKKKVINNFNSDKADIFSLYLIIGSIVSARVLDFVFFNPAVLFSDPLEVFMIWHGGMSFHGGLIGGIFASYLFCKKYDVNFYKLADFSVIPFSLILFFGRIANFINGELPGTVSSVSWCVKFSGFDGCRHPTQLYEATKNLLIFITLIPFYNMKKFKDGVIFWLFILMYGVLRFIINFWRDDERWLFLSMGQYLCIVMIIFSVFFLFRINQKERVKNKKN